MALLGAQYLLGLAVPKRVLSPLRQLATFVAMTSRLGTWRPLVVMSKVAAS
jgi:hypothetical protein